MIAQERVEVVAIDQQDVGEEQAGTNADSGDRGEIGRLEPESKPAIQNSFRPTRDVERRAFRIDSSVRAHAVLFLVALRASTFGTRSESTGSFRAPVQDRLVVARVNLQ